MRDLPAGPNILILNADLPVFPGRAGHEFLHTTGLARLAHRVGLVSLVHTPEQARKKAGLEQAGVHLFLWESPHLPPADAPTPAPAAPPPTPAVPWRRHLINAAAALARTFLRRPHDTLIQDLQFQNIAPPILDALTDDDWHALIVIQSSCARWLDYLPRFPLSVLVLHDVRALAAARQARHAPTLRQWFSARAESRRYHRWEHDYCRKFDLVVTVSSTDEAWVRQHYQPKHLVTIPIPVDGDFFHPLPGVPECPSRIVFTGMMNHPPNVDAACFFARQILPLIQRHIPDAEFWIVGRDPAPQVMALTALPGVVVTGAVPDIRPYIAQAATIVVPLRYASGMRNKILEAWAMRKCVISTTIGAEGLDYTDHQNILIADDAPTFADRVTHVLRDPSFRDRIRSLGRDLVTTRHAPATLTRQYNDAIAAALSHRRAASPHPHSLIDLRWMRPGQAGGMENLSRSFLKHLLRLDQVNRYTLLVPPEVRFDFDLRRNPNVTVVGRERVRYTHLLRTRLTRTALGLLGIPTPARSGPSEALHCAAEWQAQVALSIPSYICPDLYGLRNVLIVQDLQHEYYPQFFTAAQLEERRRVYADSIAHARHLIAISQYTKQTLIEKYHLDPERIDVAYQAADPLFHPEHRRHLNGPAIRRKYHLTDQTYLLMPANTWPHKNHQGAFEAMAILRDRHGRKPLLICTGTPQEAHSTLADRIERLKLADQIRFLGYCPAEDMPAIYEGAAATLYPSFFEGFGIPPLEAMWCDCPVICSNVTSLPEVVGPAALQVDPHDPAELADAIRRVLDDPDLRRTLIEAGRLRAPTFSWERFTTQIVQTLHRVAQS